MQRHDDGSVTLTAREWKLVSASWNEVTGALDSLPSSIDDFLTYRNGDDTPYRRYQKADALMNGEEWPGIRARLIEDYGGEEYADEAREEYWRYFDETESDEEAEAMLDPREDEDDA